MTLRITRLDPAALPALQALWDAQLAPHAHIDLADDLQSPARAYGKNAAVAWRGDEPVGCAGWVTLGIAGDGCAYGAPVVAADREAATALIETVCREARTAGAQRIRISTRAGENAKLASLREAGFEPLFEFVNFSRALPIPEAAPLPDGLHAIRMNEVDWTRLYRCFAESFAGVPNSPIVDEATFRAEWATVDRPASAVLVDETGEYQGFVAIFEDKVDSIGITQKWRGKNLATTLYHLAATELAARGKTEIRVPMVASINTSSMRLHQKLGFTEFAPRTVVHELSLPLAN